VSFPEKLREIVATRCEIFSLKFTKYHLAAARLRPDPLGELKRPLNPLPTIRGLLLKGGMGRGGTFATSLQNVFHAIVMTKQFVCTEVCYHSASQPPSLVFHFLKSS